MPKPARSSRTQPSGPTAVAQVVRDEPEFEFDSMDIMLGVILLLGIPALTYVILSGIGMSVSGAKTKDATAAFEERERQQKLEANVPLAPREFEAKITWVRNLLDTRIPMYLDRAKGEEDKIIKNHWVKAASTTVGHCEGILKSLERGIKANSEFDSDPSYAQNVKNQLSRVAQLRRDIDQLDEFKGLRGS
ncbi:MAG: hypothetical protein AAF488_08010 [Planctomycetota bacterium]